jgi:hypothetical protein
MTPRTPYTRWKEEASTHIADLVLELWLSGVSSGLLSRLCSPQLFPFQIKTFLDELGVSNADNTFA